MTMNILVLVFVVIGMLLGVRRTRRRLDKKIALINAKKKGRSRRVDQSEDAPAAMTPAELKAMGRWFQE
jgi:hypothetical protein